MDFSNYNSKKFAAVVLLIVATFILAMNDKLNPVVGSIFTAIGVMYPATQGYVDGGK